MFVSPPPPPPPFPSRGVTGGALSWLFDSCAEPTSGTFWGKRQGTLLLSHPELGFLAPRPIKLQAPRVLLSLAGFYSLREEEAAVCVASKLQRVYPRRA